MASLQGTMVARRLIMEMSQALVSTVEIASSPIPTSNSSSIEDIGSYLLSRSKVKPPTIIVILLLITFFLLGFFSIYFRRWYANGDTTAPPNQPITPSHNTTLAADPPPPPPPTTASDLPPLASSKGLDMEIIESLPKIIFSSSSHLHPPTNEKKHTECVICLEVFEEEETLRLIPRCGHIFHSECINMWLLSQTSCPLCRHSLLLPLKADKSSTEDEEGGHGGHSLLVVLQSPPHAGQHH